jgi:hypothetical protein
MKINTIQGRATQRKISRDCAKSLPIASIFALENQAKRARELNLTFTIDQPYLPRQRARSILVAPKNGTTRLGQEGRQTPALLIFLDCFI